MFKFNLKIEDGKATFRLPSYACAYECGGCAACETHHTDAEGRGLFVLRELGCHGTGEGHQNCRADHPRWETKQLKGLHDFRINDASGNTYKKLHALIAGE